MARPHDVADVLLAPVALAFDTRLEELGRLTPAELEFEVALEGDKPQRTREFREDGLLVGSARAAADARPAHPRARPSAFAGCLPHRRLSREADRKVDRGADAVVQVGDRPARRDHRLTSL